MRKSVLIFSNTSSLADFVREHRIAKAEVSSGQRILPAELMEDKIDVACTEYGAELKSQPYSDAFANEPEDWP